MSDKRYYHGTSAANWSYIKLSGLQPGKGKGADQWAMEHNPRLALGIARAGLRDGTAKERAQSVYLTSLIDVAAMFADYAAEVTASKPIILEVTLPDDARLVMDEQMDADALVPAFRCPCVIPPSHIREAADIPNSDAFFYGMRP